MTARTERKRAARSSRRRLGREAGFDCTRRELEERVGSELLGVATGPKLLSSSGLWVTFLAREPCCGARLLLNVRAREQLNDGTLDDVFRAAGRSRDLRHPSVLSTRRFGSTDDVVWVTTRAYRGRLLRIIPGTEPGAGRSRALDFIRRVAGPLEAVHRDGLVHGALGEASFHCDTEGRIRIRNLELDVPLVRHFSETGFESGTVSSAAPEVLDGATPSAESDQYALAALLVRLLTGRPPEANGSVEWHAVPGPMRRPLRRALRLDPEERFPSVLETWEALDPEQAGRRPARRGRGLEPRPDAEMPGSPMRPVHDQDARDPDGVADSQPVRRARGRPSPERDRSSPRRKRPAATSASSSGRADGLGARRRPETPAGGATASRSGATRRRSTMGSWGRRRGRRRGAPAGDGGSSGPLSRTFAAAAALVLLFGTVEVVGEWDSLSPFDRSAPDTLPPTALSRDPTGAETALGTPEDRAEQDVSSEQGITGGDELSMPPADEPEASDAGASSPDLDDPGQRRADAARRQMTRPTRTREAETEVAAEEVATRKAEPIPRPTPTSRSTAAEGETAQPQEPGTLSLHSYPWGEVYLDGDYVGNSPIVGLRVSAGSHEVRIERDGYEPYVEMITVEAGDVVRRTGIVLRSGAR
jgi:hypothetical protein